MLISSQKEREGIIKGQNLRLPPPSNHHAIVVELTAAGMNNLFLPLASGVFLSPHHGPADVANCNVITKPTRWCFVH